MPHAGDHGGAPFALWTGEALAAVETVQGGQLHKTFQARHAKKEGAGKVRGGEVHVRMLPFT